MDRRALGQHEFHSSSWDENKMPKQKTNSGAKKRFRLTATGKIRRFKAYKSHILTKKHPKRKRNLRHGTLIAKADESRIKRLLQA